ncbi:PELI [Lepeophtheirus salmonis]|uniref:PELI n=1 Tax=Lepeophtheirus salmonis TaxID=72036 RepID=A0A7R8CGX8_LEPSM|nr:PELI [Lepeophtheirus salmonis]CAF2819162.1 PELI [Lepeophtheirus salmonis]
MHESGLESVCVGTVESGVGNVKYGELILLGYNGGLPQGDRGRRRSKFLLYRRLKANGVVKSRHYTVGSPYDSSAMKDSLQHSISYTLSRHQAVIVEYVQDWKTDLFQIGRSSESPIDFVVMDTTPGNKVVEKFSSQSTISRFACRVIADRDSGLKTRVYAAGFDSSRNIFLGEKATKWQVENNELDGLTTNGVLIMHPNGTFCDKSGNEFARPGIWREVSVGGCIFSLRESRSAAIQGSPIHNEDNILQDGTLIDLCGATLIWRSAEGLSYSPTYKQLEQCIDNLNAGRPQCPVGLHTLVVPRKNSKNTKPEAQPFVYLNCGHVQAQLTMGTEPGLYTDCLPPEFCFVPCGHMASERTVKYWASVPIPCGTSGFETACPFCAVPLARSKGYMSSNVRTYLLAKFFGIYIIRLEIRESPNRSIKQFKFL